MSPDVRTWLHDAAAVPASPPDVGAALRAGRRLRARRNSMRAAAGALAAAAVVGVASVAAPPRVRDAAPAAPTLATRSDVEAFVTRAAVEASLASGGTREYTVRSALSTDDGWVVDLGRTPCRGPSPCVVQARVGADGGTLSIDDALGSWPERDRVAVLGFRGAPGDAPEMLFRTVEIARSRGAARLVLTSGWTGPIPARGLSVDCVVRAYDAAGAVVATRALDPTLETLPRTEAERAGGFVGVAVPPKARSGTIECATFRSGDAAGP